MKRWIGLALLSVWMIAAIAQAASTSAPSPGLGYLWQAMRGQLALWNRARPLSEVVADERISPRIRSLLGRVPEVKAFGEKKGLKPTSNYQEFVALDRPAVVWVVSAAPEFSFEPMKWSFPVAGEFSYLGFFSRERADAYASQLRSLGGWDVDVRGASAYSTLGWFRDPVLSTMISDGEEAWGELVELVLHESVHATVFVPNQSEFNESLAQFSGEQLAREFFLEKRGGSSEDSSMRAYLNSLELGKSREKRLRTLVESLRTLYSQVVTQNSELRSKKLELIQSARQELGWKRELNNATLVQFETYGSKRWDFSELLRKDCRGDWPCFFKKAPDLLKRP